MVDIPIIPFDVSTGMTVDIVFTTAVNEAESGVSGRKSARDIPLRMYTITVNPDYAEDVMAIILACRGARWPVALRDWAGNYQLEDTEVDTSGTLVRIFTPSTGSRTFSQPILIVDDTDAGTIVKVNGVTQTEGTDYTITNGTVTFTPPLATSPAPTVTITGSYLIPCVFVEDSLTVTVHAQDLFSIDNVRLREIPEAEFLALTA